MAINIIVISSSGTPNLTKFKNIENENPVIASTLLSANIGSRVGKPTGSTVILLTSRLFADANAGNWAHAPSGGGAPKIFPSKSFGELVPRLFLPAIANGGLS